jgi:hypothetical protein
VWLYQVIIDEQGKLLGERQIGESNHSKRLPFSPDVFTIDRTLRKNQS